MQTIKVSVNAEDIANGKPGSFSSCAIARAFNRTIGERWIVGHHRAHKIGTSFSVDLPLEVGLFIDDFDAGRRVTPMEFEVQLP